jgi:type VI protein secretion system component VasF
MKLAELCEPMFQYVCRLNRSARKGAMHDQDQVRAEVVSTISAIQNRAKSDPALAAHLDKERGGIYLVLLFFADSMIRNSKLSFAADWQYLSYDEGELAADDTFFEMLDKTLADTSDAASERIGIYYTCMGLGFTGSHPGQPDYLRGTMEKCAWRMRGQINANPAAKVCPEAYNADTRVLFKPIRASLVGMTIALVILMAAVLTINGYQYYEKSKDLNATLDQLNAAAEKPAAAGN